MSAEPHLTFQIQGSAQLPYRLTAYGFGDAFRMFCTCPAGRKARLLCKHVVAVLMGEVGALVEPSDDILQLAEQARGSLLLTRAFYHHPKPTPNSIALNAPVEEGFEKAFASLVWEARALGWSVKAGTAAITLHRTTKSGKPRKDAALILGHRPRSDHPFRVSGPEIDERNCILPEHAGRYFFRMMRCLPVMAET